MSSKAYRQVGEMEQIRETFDEEGFDSRIFLRAAETYRRISEDTELYTLEEGERYPSRLSLVSTGITTRRLAGGLTEGSLR